MSTWWWLLAVPVAHVAVGWVVAWIEAARTMRLRAACRHCGGAGDHGSGCACDRCRNRGYVCDEHEMGREMGPLALLLVFWPIWVVLEIGGAMKRAWDRVDPGRIVEERARKNSLHVLVASPDDEEDKP